MRKWLMDAGVALAVGLMLSSASASACPMCGAALSAQSTGKGVGNPAVGFAIGGSALLAMPFALVTGFGVWFYRLARQTALGDESESTPSPPTRDARDRS